MKIGLVVAVCLWAGIACGAEQSRAGKHCLWRVTNAKAPFYILGSIHALRYADYPLPEAVEAAMKQSQQFYFEYDPKLDAEFGRKLVAAAEYPRGVQIKGKIRPETFKYLLKITQSGAGTWQHLKPWAIAMFMLSHPAYFRISSKFGIDNYVDQKARARGCPRYGLETIDEHVNVFAGMNPTESEVFLLESLVFGGMQGKQFPEFVSAWKTGNTQRIYALDAQITPEIMDAPNLNRRLLANRNLRWIPKIQAAIKSGRPTMVVAGTLHFIGPGNVLELLRARGYKIEQL